MSKQTLLSDDALVMKVRKLLKAAEPRPTPTDTRRSPFGFDQVACPVCSEWCSAKRGSYNYHWTLEHGTPFWKEKKLIALISREQPGQPQQPKEKGEV